MLSPPPPITCAGRQGTRWCTRSSWRPCESCPAPPRGRGWRVTKEGPWAQFWVMGGGRGGEHATHREGLASLHPSVSGPMCPRARLPSMHSVMHTDTQTPLPDGVALTCACVHITHVHSKIRCTHCGALVHINADVQMQP